MPQWRAVPWLGRLVLQGRAVPWLRPLVPQGRAVAWLRRLVPQGRSMPWLRRLVAELSLRKPEFDPRPINPKFVVNKVALEQVLSEFFRFVVSKILPHFHFNSLTTDTS